MKFQIVYIICIFFYFYMLKKIDLKKLESLSLFIIHIIHNISLFLIKMQDIYQQKENYIYSSQKFYFRTFLAFLLQFLLFFVFLIQFTKDFLSFFHFQWII